MPYNTQTLKNRLIAPPKAGANTTSFTSPPPASFTSNSNQYNLPKNAVTATDVIPAFNQGGKNPTLDLPPLTSTVNSGGGGKGNKGGKGGKKNPIQKYLLGDEDYQNTIRDLVANFESFKTQNLTNRGNLNQDFLDTNRRLGLEQNKQKSRLQEEFASRGLFGSGIYGSELSDFNEGFLQQFTDAETSNQRNLAQLVSDLANARRLMQQQKADARLAALRRRAAKLGEF